MSLFCAASFKGAFLPAQPHLAPHPQLAAPPLRALCALSELCVNSFLFPFIPASQLSSNSFRITSFADPYSLTPIESHLYKKHGMGVPMSVSSCFFFASLLHYIFNSFILKGNLHV
jgi:hypothetical protein